MNNLAVLVRADFTATTPKRNTSIEIVNTDPLYKAIKSKLSIRNFLGLLFDIQTYIQILDLLECDLFFRGPDHRL